MQPCARQGAQAKMAERNLTIVARLDLAERNLIDHAKSLSAHTDFMRMLELRVGAIEDARRIRALDEARREEREEAREIALNLRLDGIVKDIAGLREDVKAQRSGWIKLAWVVIGAFAVAGVAWIVQGGMAK